MLLVASPGFPGNDIADIIRLAKEKPKSLSIAISAIGTPNHLGAEMLTQFGNIDLVFVPYDGISQAIPDLIANRVERSPHSQPCYRRSKPARSKPWPLPRRNARRSRRRFRQPQRRDCRRCRSMHGSVSWAPAARRRTSSPASTLKSPRLWRCPNYAKPFAQQGIDIFHLNPNELREFLHAEAARLGDLLKHSRVNASSR